MKKYFDSIGFILFFIGVAGIIYFRFSNPHLTEVENLMKYWWGYILSVTTMFSGYLLLVFYGRR